MNIIYLIAPILAGTILPGCSYRLTNKSLTPPAEIRSIAIESPYNTSEQVFPIEILWNQTQREFIKYGRPRLTSRQNADAILTLKILHGEIAPTGTASIEAISSDPKYGSDSYLNPNAYPNLAKEPEDGLYGKSYLSQ